MFFEASEQAPRIVAWILNQIGWLYHWERELRESHAGANLRAAVRSARGQMVLGRLKRVFEMLQFRYLPKSLLGKAISYALRQWPELTVYVEAGRVEIDNNLIENAIRPTAIGKKNWMFMGSEEAGERNALIDTLVGTCRMHGIEPYEYLSDVLQRLPTTTNQDVDQLLPLNWQKNRQAPLRARA
jgi:transposase